MAESYYEVLGVSPECTSTELTRAFRKLALLYHPDKNPEGDEKFREISKAYSVLIDPEARVSYDRGQFDPDRFEPRFGDFSNFNFDIPSEKSQDLVSRLNVDLEALYNGRLMQTKVKTILACPLCLMVKAPSPTCKICSGTRKRTVTKQFKVNIKKGTFTGQKIRFIGEGNEWPNYLPGDLVFVISTTPHRRFQLEGQDLVAKIDLPISTAMKGGVLHLETLDNRWLRFKIKSLMTADGLDVSGTRVVYDEGMPDYFEPSTKGNLFVEFGLDLPEVFERKTNAKLRNKLINFLPLELDFDENKIHTLEVFDMVEARKNFKEGDNFKAAPYVFYGPPRDSTVIRYVKTVFLYINLLFCFILRTVKRFVVAIYKTFKLCWKLIGLAIRPLFWIADFILSFYWFHYHVWVPNIFGIQYILSWFCIFCYVRRCLKFIRFVLRL